MTAQPVHARTTRNNTKNPCRQPGGTWFGTRLVEAVRAGQFSEARIDDAVLRILRPMFALGLFDHPVQVNPLPEREHREVAAVNPRTIVVLTASGPIQTNTWQQRVPSILQAWYGGQEQGNAIARILFGQVNPSGKLPITFPVDEATTPIDTPQGFPGVNETSVYSEGIFVGYRGYDQFRLPVQYPFGYGLSYTSFAYNGLRVNDSNRTVSFNLRNTGRYAGAEVAQVYVGRLPTRTATPPKQLAGWARVTLRPGQQQRVTVTLENDSLSYWDEASDRWVTPRGPLPIYVGTSSRQIRIGGSAFIR
jgi:beta-glucosidase